MLETVLEFYCVGHAGPSEQTEKTGKQRLVDLRTCPAPAAWLINQFARIKQMLRTEMLARPAAALRQFHAKKVPCLLMPAMAYSAKQFSIAIVHNNSRACRYRALYLQTDAGERNVFQIRDASAITARFVLPDHLHELRTEQPAVVAAIFSVFLHTPSLSVRKLLTVRIRLSFPAL